MGLHALAGVLGTEPTALNFLWAPSLDHLGARARNLHERLEGPRRTEPPTSPRGRATLRPMARPQILIVQGTTDHGSRLASVATVTEGAVREAGGDPTLLDLGTVGLPVMVCSDASQGLLPSVQLVRTTAAQADGFVLITPEYHGNMSGALKNWFDFLYLELAGKFAGLMAVTGGGGGDMSITSVKNSFNWCHGFTLPFHAIARPGDFQDDILVSSAIIERIQRIGHDVVRYAPVIRGTFERARQLGRAPLAGVAGLHAAK